MDEKCNGRCDEATIYKLCIEKCRRMGIQKEDLVLIVGEASTPPNEFPSPSDTQPTFLEELLSHRRRVRSRREAKKEIKKGIKKESTRRRRRRED